MDRSRVLIVAHELSPEQGSECAEGWNLVTRLGKYHEVTVLYARGSQFAPDAYEQAVHRYLESNELTPSIRFIPISQPRMTLWLASVNKKFSKRTSGIGLPFLYATGYRLWQKKVYRFAKTYYRQSSVDIIHQLTSINFREPGYLWKLPVPFVWGPTGGTLTIPKDFYRHIGRKQALFEALRSLSNRLTISCNKRVQGAIRNSALIYSFSKEDQIVFQKKGARRVDLLLDAGCSGLRSPVSVLPSSSGLLSPVSVLPSPVSGLRSPVSLLWVGQLVRRKALDILLKAIADDRELKNTVKLTIVGDGPLRNEYERFIQGKLSDMRYPIIFTGWLTRDQVFNQMKQSAVLVHTSYREATSNVIPEALSCGLPVICHDISGMAIAVTDECGIKIPLKTYSASVAGFRRALHQLVDSQTDTGSSPLMDQWSAAAIKRASEISWDSMAKRIAEDYARIAHQSK